MKNCITHEDLATIALIFSLCSLFMVVFIKPLAELTALLVSVIAWPIATLYDWIVSNITAYIRRKEIEKENKIFFEKYGTKNWRERRADRIKAQQNTNQINIS